MKTAFLDANVLFSAAWREGSGLNRIWALSQMVLVTSGYAVEEARRNLESDEQRTRLVRLLSNIIIMAESPGGVRPADYPLPEKDWPILNGAVEAGAEVLVTGDLRHFGFLLGKRFQGVLVQTPAQFLAANGKRIK